jgi:N-acyl-D-aspartate/D-glutamate deacylase
VIRYLFSTRWPPSVDYPRPPCYRATVPDFDLLIQNASIIDGTGTPAFPAAVAVRDGRIAALGSPEGVAARTIDAVGLTVAPGFIDVHAHDDDAVINTPMDFKLMQGVTTDIVGNCGAGQAPRDPNRPPMPGVNFVLGARAEGDWQTFGEYMDAVERAHPAVNVACFIPHGAVRYAAMGTDNRPPTDAELNQMREHIAEGMAAGALGVSTGLIYPPGAYARTDELVELATVAAQHGGIYMSHIRNEGDRLLEAIEEAVTIGREAGLPVEISHHKAGSRATWGKTHESIAYLEQQRAAGLEVTWDAYPYTAGSTILAALARSGDELDPEALYVASVKHRHEYEGKSISEIASTLDLPPDHALRRVLSEEPEAVAVYFMMDEGDVRRVLAHPLCMIGSDGIPSPTGKPHPRLYGTFPRVLGLYSREERLFPLEEAIRKMTSLPANRMNLPERGEIREGYDADLVIFDPETINDTATYEEPRRYPSGIEYVIVNGEIAAERGNQNPVRAGRLLRRGDPA